MHNTFLYSQQQSNAVCLSCWVSRKIRALFPKHPFRSLLQPGGKDATNEKKIQKYLLPILLISAETTGNFL